MSSGKAEEQLGMLSRLSLLRPGVEYMAFYSDAMQNCLQAALVQVVLRWCSAYVALSEQHLGAQLMRWCSAGAATVQET